MNDHDDPDVISIKPGVRTRRRFIEDHLASLKISYGRAFFEQVGEEYFRAHLEDFFDRYLVHLREETSPSERTLVVGYMMTEILQLRMQRDGKLPNPPH